MTHDEIKKLEAGRELDALIAEKVMGYARNPDVKPYGFGDAWLQHYSTDIAAAWEVVNAICIPAPEDCWTGPVFHLTHDKSESWLWQVVFEKLDSLDGVNESWCGDEYTEACAETAPLAICRAALMVVMK